MGKEISNLMMGVAAGVLGLTILRGFTLHESARRKLYLTLETNGARVVNIREFKRFLDLDSIWAAATSAPYRVVILERDGCESELFCLVRYIPLIGLARSVEILSTTPRS